MGKYLPHLTTSIRHVVPLDAFHREDVVLCNAVHEVGLLRVKRDVPALGDLEVPLAREPFLVLVLVQVEIAIAGHNGVVVMIECMFTQSSPISSACAQVLPPSLLS